MQGSVNFHFAGYGGGTPDRDPFIHEKESKAACHRQRAFPGGDKINRDALATRWIERNAAAGYVLIGDPAVRLRAEELAV